MVSDENWMKRKENIYISYSVSCYKNLKKILIGSFFLTKSSIRCYFSVDVVYLKVVSRSIWWTIMCSCIWSCIMSCSIWIWSMSNYWCCIRFKKWCMNNWSMSNIWSSIWSSMNNWSYRLWDLENEKLKTNYSLNQR